MTKHFHKDLSSSQQPYEVGVINPRTDGQTESWEVEWSSQGHIPGQGVPAPRLPDSMSDAQVPQGHKQLQVSDDKAAACSRWCSVGQGDGCDFCVRQFHLPCPSITDSTPHLAPSFTGGDGAGSGMLSWSAKDGVMAEAPGTGGAQNGHGTNRTASSPTTHHPVWATSGCRHMESKAPALWELTV